MRADAYAFTRALPPYCCAILRSAATGLLLVEERPADAKVAAGRLTCFGGKREPGETAEAAVRRELAEELGGWAPAEVNLRRAVDLYVDGALVAYFYEAEGPGDDVALSFEPGRRGLWMAPDALASDARLSVWHSAVLRAWARGDRRADYDSAGEG